MLLSNTVSISLRAKIEQLHGILVDIVRFVLSTSGTMLLLPLALLFSVSSASRNIVWLEREAAVGTFHTPLFERVK
jgi:hypothetical protein